MCIYFSPMEFWALSWHRNSKPNHRQPRRSWMFWDAPRTAVTCATTALVITVLVFIFKFDRSPSDSHRSRPSRPTINYIAKTFMFTVYTRLWSFPLSLCPFKENYQSLNGPFLFSLQPPPPLPQRQPPPLPSAMFIKYWCRI